jgi:transposase InsO family protein
VPWKVSHPVNERMHFVTRLENGERMTDLCQEYGISRKTGYKFWERFKEKGPQGLVDASRAPRRVARRTPAQLQELIVAARRAHPTWGGRKLKKVLERQHDGLVLPSSSTVSDILRRHGLVVERRRQRRTAEAKRSLTVPQTPNEVWAVDYKGQFRLGNGKYCYPLTATEVHSRFLLAVQALEGTDDEEARQTFHEVFKEHGLPRIIRSDNGTPFASSGLAGLTKLSAWWLRLGIAHQRTQPAHPEQNGQHERMHRTLKAETTRPAGTNALQQQERFDDFRREFNEVRPHEALGLKTPAQAHQPSERRMPDHLPEPAYPLHDDVLVVGRHGHVRLPRHRSVFLSQALAGQAVGLREEEDGRWLVTFTTLDLGHYDPRTGRLEPLAAEIHSPRS